jgi:type IV pilus assembly protein PilZ
MDYVEGGVFIPTHKKYNLGVEVFMLLSLMGEAERIPVAGTIIWVTPAGRRLSF